MVKRSFDLVASLMGLIVLSPLLVAIALMIRADGGPAFFRQVRVGKAGRLFRIFKFRTMVVDAEKLGTQVTSEHDPRITRIGRILRKTKLDELPQLLNVFLGDMSIVGPRPEVAYYVKKWPEEDKRVILSVKPGITDYATLFYNDEQSVLAEADDPEEAYMEEVMPHKLGMYMRYVEDHNFWLDLRLVLATLGRMAGLNVRFLVPEVEKVGRSEDRGQKTEDGGRKSEDRGQRSEVGSRRSEVRGRKSEVGGQRSDEGAVMGMGVKKE